MSRSVALGTFDGVHLGHRRVIQTAIERAQALGVRSAVATFDPRPVSVIVPERAPDSLTSLERRLELLREAGVDDVLVIKFTLELASRTPAQFADEVLVGQLEAAEVVVGQNFRFGHNRAGDVDVLRELGLERGFGVTVAPLFEFDGEPVSSSRIRELIRLKYVEDASRILGRPPALEGEVVRGDGRGRALGVPTANLGMTPGFVQPAEGVYAGDVVLADGRSYRAAISVGTNPTFDGEREVRVEAHLLHFDEDIYGTKIRVDFRRFLRGQRRFDNLDDLVAQMRADIAAAEE
jgi:riboflavin kinase / FMN adenylyltransferase